MPSPVGRTPNTPHTPSERKRWVRVLGILVVFVSWVGWASVSARTVGPPRRRAWTPRRRATLRRDDIYCISAAGPHPHGWGLRRRIRAGLAPLAEASVSFIGLLERNQNGFYDWSKDRLRFETTSCSGGCARGGITRCASTGIATALTSSGTR